MGRVCADKPYREFRLVRETGGKDTEYGPGAFQSIFRLKRVRTL